MHTIGPIWAVALYVKHDDQNYGKICTITKLIVYDKGLIVVKSFESCQCEIWLTDY